MWFLNFKCLRFWVSNLSYKNSETILKLLTQINNVIVDKSLIPAVMTGGGYPFLKGESIIDFYLASVHTICWKGNIGSENST